MVYYVNELGLLGFNCYSGICRPPFDRLRVTVCVMKKGGVIMSAHTNTFACGLRCLTLYVSS